MPDHAPTQTRGRPWIRWLAVVPVSLGAGFALSAAPSTLLAWVPPSLVGSAGPLAALTGAAYVLGTCTAAWLVAPKLRRAMASLLGLFVIGDLAFVHLVAPDLFTTPGAPAADPMAPLLGLLRVADVASVPNGGLWRVAGAGAMGMVLVLSTQVDLGRLLRDGRVQVVAWGVALAGLIHMDWHLGRPTTMRMSLGLSWHWVSGLAFGTGMGWFFWGWSRFDRPTAAALTAGLGGLLLGQVVQPLSEVLFMGSGLAWVFGPLRTGIFAAFAVAWLVGLGAGWALARWVGARSP